jgi:non-ribosomal peptide synthetase component F
MLDRSDGISLRSGFLRNAGERPDAPAVVVRGVTRSYGELEQVARRWANADHRCFPIPRGTGLDCSPTEVKYRIRARSQCYVQARPLNPTFPAEKITSMIQQADLDAIIVDKTCAPQLSAVLAGINAPPPLLLPEFDSPGFPAFKRGFSIAVNWNAPRRLISFLL